MAEPTRSLLDQITQSGGFNPVGPTARTWAAEASPEAKKLVAEHNRRAQARVDAYEPPLRSSGAASDADVEGAESRHETVPARDWEWSPVSRAIGLLGGFTEGSTKDFGASYLAGKRRAEQERKERRAGSDKLAPQVARSTHNTATDLFDLVSTLPGLAAQTIMPHEVPIGAEGESAEERSNRAMNEGDVTGKQAAQGLIGGTADILEHPIDSFESRPFSTAATLLPFARMIVKGTRATTHTIAKHRAPPPPAPPEGPPPHGEVMGPETQNPFGDEPPPAPPAPRTPPPKLADDLLYRAGQNIKRVLGTAPVIKTYLKNLVDGFHAGDPRATVLVEKLARTDEHSNAILKVAGQKLGVAVSRDLARQGAAHPQAGLDHMLGGVNYTYPEPAPADLLTNMLNQAAGEETYQRASQQLGDLAQRHGQAEQALTERHANELNGIQEQANQAAERAAAGHPAQVENLRLQHEAQAQELAQEHARQQEALDTRHQAAQQELQTAQAQLEALPEPTSPQDWQERIALRDRITALSTEVSRQGREAAALERRQQAVRDRGVLERRQQEARDALARQHETQVDAAFERHRPRYEARAAAHPGELEQQAIQHGAERETLMRETRAERQRQVTAEREHRDTMEAIQGGQYIPEERTVDEAQVGGEVHSRGTPATQHIIDSPMLADRASRLTGETPKAIDELVGEIHRVHGMEGNEDWRSYHEPALRQKIMMSLTDAFGERENQAGWRGQWRGNPERFAREYLTAAEQALHRRLSKPEKAGLLEALDRDAIQHEELPDYNVQAASRERTVPRLRNQAGDWVSLDPDELVQPRELDAKETRQAVESGIQHITTEYRGQQARNKVLMEEAWRPQEWATNYDPIDRTLPRGQRHLASQAAEERYTAAAHDALSGNDPVGAEQQVANYARGVVVGMEHTDTPPQLLPPGMRPKLLADVLERANPGNKAVKALADEIGKYRKVDPIAGIGTAENPAYAAPLAADALEWHAKAARGIEADLLRGLNNLIKGNLTSRSLTSGVNNLVPNMSGISVYLGTDPVSYIAKSEVMMRQMSKWADAGAAPTQVRGRAFENLARSDALNMDWVTQELENRPMTEAQKLRNPKSAAIKAFFDSMPQNKFSEWFYQHGDQIVRLQEGVTQFERMAKTIDKMEAGQYYDLATTRRKTVRIGFDGHDYTLEEPSDVTAAKREPRPISKAEVDRLMGEAAGVRSKMLTQDYGDLPQYAKWVKTLPIMGILSPFISWAAAAIDLPGKAGIITNTLLRSPYSVSTNIPSALAESAKQEGALFLRRAIAVQGIRRALTQQGMNGPLAMACRRQSNDDQRVIIGALTSPGYIDCLQMGAWAQGGPTGDLLGALAKAGAYVQSRAEHKQAQSEVTPFSKAVQDAETGQDFTMEKAMKLAFLSGSPLEELQRAVMQDEEAGKVFDPGKLAERLASSALGGTNVSLARIIAGGLDQEGTGVLGKLSGRDRAIGATPATTQPYMIWSIQQLLGKAWKAKDLDTTNPAHVASFLSKMQAEWNASIGTKGKTAMKADTNKAYAAAADKPDAEGDKLRDAANARETANEWLRANIKAAVKASYQNYFDTYWNMMDAQDRERLKSSWTKTLQEKLHGIQPPWRTKKGQ